MITNMSATKYLLGCPAGFVIGSRSLVSWLISFYLGDVSDLLIQG